MDRNEVRVEIIVQVSKDLTFIHFRPFSAKILQIIFNSEGGVTGIRQETGSSFPFFFAFFFSRCQNHSSHGIYGSIIQKIFSLKDFKSSLLNDYRR